MKRTLIAAALALSAIAAPAFAATGTFRMDVEFSRANLATPAGAAAEYAKIRDQIADRCAAEQPSSGKMSFGREFQVHTCTERTLSNAIRNINNANLTAAHTAAKG